MCLSKKKAHRYLLLFYSANRIRGINRLSYIRCLLTNSHCLASCMAPLVLPKSEDLVTKSSCLEISPDFTGWLEVQWNPREDFCLLESEKLAWHRRDAQYVDQQHGNHMPSTGSWGEGWGVSPPVTHWEPGFESSPLTEWAKFPLNSVSFATKLR